LTLFLKVLEKQQEALLSTGFLAQKLSMNPIKATENDRFGA
jgi:hypothetical protein